MTNSLNSINDRANSAPGTPVHPSASVIQPPPPIGNNNVVPPVGAVSIAPIGPPKPGQQRSSNDFASTMTPIGRPPSGSGGYGIIGSGLGGSNSSIIRSKTPERDPILEGGIPPSSNQVSSALSGGIIGSNRPSSATLGPALPLGGRFSRARKSVFPAVFNLPIPLGNNKAVFS